VRSRTSAVVALLSPLTAAESPVRALAGDAVLRRVGAALALYRLAEFGPWIAIPVFAYDHGGATSAGIVSLGLLVPTASLRRTRDRPLRRRTGAGRRLCRAGIARAALDATERDQGGHHD